MSKIKYRAISESLSNLVKPMELSQARASIGLDKNIGEYYYILIEDLIPFENQARQHFSETEITALAKSVKEHGIRQPLTVISCDNKKGKYQIISGERRLKAAKIAGLEKVPCILLKDRLLAEEIAIVENIHRQDLHPIELGTAFGKLLENKLFASQKELAEKFSMSKSTISELLSYSNLDVDLRKHLIVSNITTRSEIRKISKDFKEKQGLHSYVREPKSLVIKVSLSSSGFKLQTNGIDKLSDNQKQNLRSELNKVLELL